MTGSSLVNRRSTEINSVMEYTCHYCQKISKNHNSHRNHERLCPKNPNRVYVSRTKGRPAWNKGLTKYTDDRVRANSEAISKSMKGKAPLWEWTEERRRKKSEWRKKLHEENPETHPNRCLASNRKKWTYPERVAGTYLDEQGVEFDYNPKVGKYYPDFWIRGTNILIEIDGERWHDPDKDAIRDSTLLDMGYIVHRIKSKSDIRKELAIILSKISNTTSV